MSINLESSSEVLYKNVCSDTTIKSIKGDNFVHLYNATVTGKASATHGPAIVENSSVTKVKAVGELYFENSHVDKLVLIVPKTMVGKITMINSTLQKGLIIKPEGGFHSAHVELDVIRGTRRQRMLLSHSDSTYTVEELVSPTPSPRSPRENS